uniref:Uncharacterized protein n=1 Tax=Panagrolaimus davidi TaxID=227884 RepID=A0A914PIF5_9BILA
MSSMEQSQTQILQLLQNLNQQQIPPPKPIAATPKIMEQSIGLRRRSLSIARPSTLSAVEDYQQPIVPAVVAIPLTTAAKPPQLKTFTKLSMRKRHSVSLSGDMEQMQLMSATIPSFSTHDEIIDREENGKRKVSTTSMISTESSRSSSIHSLSSFNEIDFRSNNEKIK